MPDGSQAVSKQYKDIGSVYAPTINVVEAYDWNNIASATTTTVKTSAGILHAIQINTAAAVAFTVYDSTATDVTTDPIAAFAASSAIGTYFFDAKMANGIQINCAGSGPDITVIYK